MSFPGTEHYREKAKEYQWLYDQGHKYESSYSRHAQDVLALCNHIEDLEKQNEQAWERAALEARRVLKNGSKALKLERQVEEQDKEIERLREALKESGSALALIHGVLRPKIKGQGAAKTLCRITADKGDEVLKVSTRAESSEEKP